MATNAQHPSVLEFKKNEAKTLQWIKAQRFFKGFTDLDQCIDIAVSNYKYVNDWENTNFEFHADFYMEIEGGIHRVFIEALVTEEENDYSLVSYSLLIANGNEPEELIRKFHFDYANPSINTHQNVPTFHLQYGGKMSPNVVKKSMKDNKIDHWLSLPRLNFPPVNLAILLDMTFTEFKNEDTKKITEKSEWRSLIHDNEKFILTNYYQEIANFCASQDYKNTKLIRDFCYGM